ncbi:autoinducer binding domain-containing protein [Aeromonas enteropelogenes]|uniref:autoinducer binding domain-containing protein n=1 Tax=Aeromonas enteropelogenes TaxID=29489 RepID=UPI003B9EF0EA
MNKTLNIITQLLDSNDEDSLSHNLNMICKQIGIDYYQVLYSSSKESAKGFSIAIDNLPFSWKIIYDDNGFVKVDPVLLKCYEQDKPILWKNVITECCDQKNEVGLDIMLLAQEAGLTDGVTIPYHCLNGGIGILSIFTKDTHYCESDWFSIIPLICCISTYIFEILRRVSINNY